MRRYPLLDDPKVRRFIFFPRREAFVMFRIPGTRLVSVEVGEGIKIIIQTKEYQTAQVDKGTQTLMINHLQHRALKTWVFSLTGMELLTITGITLPTGITVFPLIY